MPSYHFDVGNSSTGPIGFCARIVADTPEKAIACLHDALGCGDSTIESGAVYCDGTVEYIQVYFNDQAITEADIDMIDDFDNNTTGLREKVYHVQHNELDGILEMAGNGELLGVCEAVRKIMED